MRDPDRVERHRERPWVMELQDQRVASRRDCLRAKTEVPGQQVIASRYAMVPGVGCN